MRKGSRLASVRVSLWLLREQAETPPGPVMIDIIAEQSAKLMQKARQGPLGLCKFVLILWRHHPYEAAALSQKGRSTLESNTQPCLPAIAGVNVILF